MRPGVPGGLAAAPRRRVPVHGPPGRQRVRWRRRRRIPLPLQRHAVAAGPGYRDRRAPPARLLAGGLRPHRAGRGAADGPQVPSGPGDRRRGRPREARDRRNRGGVPARPVPVLPALRRLLRAGPRPGLRQAGDLGPGGPLVRDLADLDVDHAEPAGGAAGRPGPGGAQAADVRRQPAGRLAAGRSLQRLRAGDHAARRAVPGRARSGEPRRGGLVPRGHRHRGDQGAGPGPRRVRAAARRGPGDAQAHRRRPAGRGEPAGLPRPGARLADHDAEPGAGRPADHRLPGPRRRRRRRGAVGEDRARAAHRASRTPAGRSARCC